mgnify:CR=1 FL=1
MIVDSLWDIDSNEAPTSEHTDSKFYQQALKQGQAYLTDQFNKQYDIIKLVELRSHFVDQVLQQLWQHHISDSTPVSLLAVGGYGRGELHPYSDIDLLIILDESVSDSPPSGLSSFLTQLWDIGLEIGHSVRTIEECRLQAETDITIATNLLETRFLCGEHKLYDQLQQLTVNHKTWDARRFYQQKRQEQQNRHEKYNDTANNLEPNLKESPGGLRDLQIISWVAQQHFNVTDLKGLNTEGFISDSEYATLESSQRFLWRIRFALHNIANRKQEKLMIDHQRELAIQLGYQETEHRLAVEIFMKDYYLCARSVGQMNDLLLQLFEENIILADEPRDVTPINRRFQVHNGYLETINSGIFAFYPIAMLELFLILQQQPEIKGVRADTIRQLYAHRALINQRFRDDLKSRSLFMEIIRQPKGVTHEFRRMNKYGVLGAYLPEFGIIVGQMQHDLFHIYTVDEHTLFLVRNLRRFSCEEYSNEFPLCSEVYYQLPKTELLFIAGLYHDIAKGRGGDHSQLGVVDARRFCKLHSLSEHDAETVAFLVRQHLSMSSTAQKCDLNDPDVIKAFAAKVKTTDRLNYLYLLTVADIRATNDNLWNGWRDSLLRQLYHATKQWLEQHDQMAKSTEELSNQKRQQALKQLVLQAWSEEKVSTLWQAYDVDYFLRHTTDQIVWQTSMRLKATQQTKQLIHIREHREKNTSEIFIFTKDKPRVFAATTSCLEQLQLDIHEAKISSTLDDDALNTYVVTGPRQDRDEIITALEKCLNNLDEIKEYCPIITPRTMKLFETQAVINFNQNEQQNHTVIDISAHDRLGLVSSIAQVFLQCGIQVINAKLTTLGDQVEDIFFISNLSGEQLTHEDQDELKAELLGRLAH